MGTARSLSGYVIVMMVGLEFLEVGLNTICKAAMRKGMSELVFVFYSNAFAVFLLLPSSFIFYRMEKLNLRVQSSQAKFVGTIASISGALIVSLYKGPPISNNVPSMNIANELLSMPKSNWVIGGFFLAGHSLFLALLFILQTWIIRDYPAELLVTTMCCIFVTVLSFIVSLIGEKDPTTWRLRPNTELIAIVYSAVYAVALRNVIHTYVLRKKGPVYVSMFKPLGMVIAVFLGVTILGDILHLGSVIGGAVIALGFYAVIWGQAQQDRNRVEVEETKTYSSLSHSHTVPLLQNKCTEV
ncbi:WAT1-related protein At5g40240 isoform X2 [Ziziphus jujuba]|uniref:WAT1-related protein n=1 Tax=Ziziphus jujuba TaxID=326968 RepID=A0ABM3I0I0_ZIZJJ|nr:WAT1-related protein At5g40240 isoform X2 [Ziziphus jujuba]